MSTATIKTEVIDGVTYQVAMLPARRATKLLTRISRMVGPALGVVLEGGAAGSLSSLLDAKVDFAKAFTALFVHTDEAGVEAVLMELAEVSRADGTELKPVAFDIHFAGAQARMWKWAAFALRSQYDDFFAALSSAAAQFALLGKTELDKP